MRAASRFKQSVCHPIPICSLDEKIRKLDEQLAQHKADLEAFKRANPLPGEQFTSDAEQPPKGSSKPGREVAGTVTVAQIRKIAETKMKDLNANDVEAAMGVILGTAKSCGIEIKG